METPLDYISYLDSLQEPYRSDLLERVKYIWKLNARPGQMYPEKDPKMLGIHGILEGRGWGKTRAGAEWVRQMAETPNTYINVVSDSMTSLTKIMMPMIMSVVPEVEISRYSSGFIHWNNGSTAALYPSEKFIQGTTVDYTWLETHSSHSRGFLDASVRATKKRLLVTGDSVNEEMWYNLNQIKGRKPASNVSILRDGVMYT